ncbi:hypothetical protein HRbin14_01734 [bacterium HR14]|nr:hypothetical protein HRbin14_01734 [bacterium HR14]
MAWVVGVNLHDHAGLHFVGGGELLGEVGARDFQHIHPCRAVHMQFRGGRVGADSHIACVCDAHALEIVREDPKRMVGLRAHKANAAGASQHNGSGSVPNHEIGVACAGKLRQLASVERSRRIRSDSEQVLRIVRANPDAPAAGDAHALGETGAAADPEGDGSAVPVGVDLQQVRLYPEPVVCAGVRTPQANLVARRAGKRERRNRRGVIDTHTLCAQVHRHHRGSAR